MTAGYGPYYGVCAQLDGTEIVIGEWQGDYDRAEREAISAFKRYCGRAYVTIYLDGGSWRDVKTIPNVPGYEPRVTDAGGCLHPNCGEISPASCYCRYTLTPEQLARYA